MSDYDSAINYALHNEVGEREFWRGGYHNDPDDPGGETKWGICKRDHPNVDIKNLTLDQADAIYRKQYWCYGGLLSQMLATKLLDWAINLEGDGRHGEAIKALQQAICVQYPHSITIDSVYGTYTETLANLCHPDVLICDMVKFISTYRAALIAKNAKLQKFAEGWGIRDHKLPNT